MHPRKYQVQVGTTLDASSNFEPVPELQGGKHIAQRHNIWLQPLMDQSGWQPFFLSSILEAHKYTIRIGGLQGDGPGEFEVGVPRGWLP